MRDQQPHLFRIRLCERQGVDTAAAGAEDVHLTHIEGIDERCQVASMVVRCEQPIIPGVAGTAPDTTRVNGDNHPVVNAGRQGGERVGFHREPEHEEYRLPAGIGQVTMDVIVQLHPGQFEHFGDWLASHESELLCNSVSVSSTAGRPRAIRPTRRARQLAGRCASTASAHASRPTT